MKKVFLAYLVLVFTRLCVAQAQSKDADSVQKPIKIDVKTAWDEKDKLKLVKAGLKTYLKQSEWAELVNLNADYAVWLTKLRRKVHGNTIFIELNIELKTPSTLGTGILLEQRHVKDTLDLEEVVGLSTIEEREIYQLIMKQLAKREMPKTLVLAVGGAVAAVTLPGVGTLVKNGLAQLGTELEAKYRADQAVEAMVVGAVLITEVKDMVDSVQTKR